MGDSYVTVEIPTGGCVTLVTKTEPLNNDRKSDRLYCHLLYVQGQRVNEEEWRMEIRRCQCLLIKRYKPMYRTLGKSLFN
jgi:hypothetical protein